MTYFKKLLLVMVVLGFGFAILACQDTSTEERTTNMTSTNLTTENTTEETTETTENIIPVEFATVDIVTETPTVDKLLEFDLYENEDNLVIEENYNPYNYTELEVLFTFTKPSGGTITQAAYWHKDYEEVTVIGAEYDEEDFLTAGTEYLRWGEESKSHYRVRINPDESGLWSYQMNVYVKGNLTQTSNDTFQVSDSEDRTEGYIQVDQANQKNFIFSKSEETYIPMGLNLAWWSTTLGAHDYYNWFKELDAVDGNMARIWLSNWSFSLHKYSYENFDSRQNIAARLDLLFELAEENGVYVMLTLINHGQFSADTNPEWAENVYNIENGGMLQYPIQFFYNAEAKAAYKNELRYLMARYGYSENLFAWELFNEVDWIDGYNGPIVSKWHNEMATFLHDNDPYNHLVTTSYKYTFGTPAFDYPSLDFCTFHSYAYADVVYYDKLMDEMLSLQEKYDKPVLFGEIGIDWEAGHSTYSSDYTGVTIRQGAWGGMLTSGGSANQWWWDTWVDRYDLWDCLQGASVYANHVDVANKSYSYLQTHSSVSINTDDVLAMGYLLEDAIYGYLYNTHWSYWNRTPESVTNVSFTVPFSNGEYTLTVFDTETGEVLSENQIIVTNNSFTIDNLTITTDYAFILK